MGVDDFFVDQRYQRPLTTLANVIAEEFDPAIFGVIVASDRTTCPIEKERPKDGEPYLAIIDGQTRWNGAKQSEEVEVPTLIYSGLTPQDEARIFADIQVKRRNLTSHQRFSAQVAAGVSRFPMQSAIVAVVESEGFKLGDASAQKQNPTIISAAAALETVWKWGEQERYDGSGAELLQSTLRILREGFPSQEKNYCSGSMIRGMATFLARYKDKRNNIHSGVDEARLIDRLRNTNINVITARANMMREATTGGGTSAKYYADSIQQEYSKRR